MLWFECASGLGVDAIEFDLQITEGEAERGAKQREKRSDGNSKLCNYAPPIFCTMTNHLLLVALLLLVVADDVLIAFHDRDWEKLTNATGLVRETTFAEMEKSVDVSESYEEYNGRLISPPSIESIFQRFAPTTVLFNVEIKTVVEDKEIVAELLCGLLEDYGLEGRMLVASFDSESLIALRKRCGDKVATSGSAEETEKALIPILLGLDHWWFQPGFLSVLQLPVEGAGFDLTDKKIIDRVHAHGMAVQYWVINDEEVMKKIILNGADGILTDEVDKLRGVLEELGYDAPESE
jgi:glycerophosphoryl diester phosphodiesterase